MRIQTRERFELFLAIAKVGGAKVCNVAGIGVDYNVTKSLSIGDVHITVSWNKTGLYCHDLSHVSLESALGIFTALNRWEIEAVQYRAG